MRKITSPNVFCTLRATRAFAALGVACAFAAQGAITPEYDDPTNPTTMTITVASGSDTLDVAIPATVTSVEKKGAGKATLTKASTAAAAITVSEGTLALGADGYIGTPTAFTVTSGATLDVSGIDTRAAFTGVQLTVGGVGAAGQEGAVVRSSGKGVAALFNLVTLTSDTTIYGMDSNCNWGWGQCGGSSSVNMNSHTLTCKGYVMLGNHHASGQMTVSNPGNIVVTESSTLKWASCNVLSVSPKGASKNYTLTLQNGALFNYYMMRPNTSDPAEWKLVVPASAQATYWASPNEAMHAHYYGDVQVDGTLTCQCFFSSTTKGDAYFTGELSGEGTLVMASTDSTYLRPVRFQANTLKNHSIGKVNVQTAPLFFQDAGTLTVTNLGFAGNSSLSGDGEVSVLGQNWDAARLARLVLDGKTVLCSGEAEGTKHKIGTTNFFHQMSIGTGNSANSQQGGVGVLEVRNGAAITNAFVVGSSYNGADTCYHGAVYLSGDASRLRWTTPARTQLGDSGYGYLAIDSGTFEMAGKESAGSGNIFLVARQNGRGYIVQRGGTATFGDVHEGRSIWLTRPSWGVSKGHSEYVHLGGTCTCDGRIDFFGSESSIDVGGDTAGLTVGGGSGVASFTTTEVLDHFTTNATGNTAWVNINAGGTLATRFVYGYQDKGGERDIRNYPASKFYVNFNGGTLKLTATNGNISYHTNCIPTRVTVFKGGATIDTDGHDIGWTVSLLRPEGYGVKSVTLSSGALAADTFVGPLRVKAIGGAGQMFSAITDFDDEGRTNRGVIVTCPGFGFAANENVSTLVRAEGRDRGYDATLSSGKAGYACTVEMEELDTTGGFTKKGAGTLTLASSNTWGGVTRVEGGTLALTHALGYPGGDLEFSAAAVTDVTTAPLFTANTFALDSGKKIRITEAETLDFAAFGPMRTIATFTNPVDANIVKQLELVDTDGNPVASEQWCLRLVNNGTTLKFGKATGFTLLLQ